MDGHIMKSTGCIFASENCFKANSKGLINKLINTVNTDPDDWIFKQDMQNRVTIYGKPLAVSLLLVMKNVLILAGNILSLS
jgi:hypothetical protein